MAGFGKKPARFMLLVSMNAPRWVAGAVAEALRGMDGEEARNNSFEARESAVFAGAKILADDDRMDPDWLSVDTVSEFSFG